MPIAKITYTSRSGQASDSRYIEVYDPDGKYVSRHLTIEECTESLTEYAFENEISGEYELRTPNKVVDVSLVLIGGGVGGPVSSSTSSLTRGAGWSGATSQPAAIGSSGDDGYDAKVIGRWSEAPHRVVDGQFSIGIPAFHFNGVDRVEFSLDNGPWVSVDSMLYNSDSGVWEYFATVDTTGLPADDTLELRARLYPNTAGQCRVLSGMYIHTPKATIPTFWVATTGSDSNDGSEGSPFLTISKALQEHQANGDGDQAVINVQAGSHDLLTYTPTANNNSQWLTIQGAPGTTRDQVILNQTNTSYEANVAYLKWKGLTVVANSAGSVGCIRPNVAGWVDDCVLKQNAVTDAWERWFGIGMDNPNKYVTDCLFTTTRNPVWAADLYRGTTIDNVLEDSFRDARAVINCVSQNVTNQSGVHGDAFQIFSSGVSWENHFCYGLKLIDNEQQALWWSGFAGGTIENVAYINVSDNHRDPDTLSLRAQPNGGIIGHVLIQNWTYLPPSRLENPSFPAYLRIITEAENIPNALLADCVMIRGEGDAGGSSIVAPGWTIRNNHWIEGPVNGTGATSGAPDMVDEPGGDYRPTSGGNLDNRAPTNLATPVDVDNNLRAGTEIGAYAKA